MGIVKGDDDEDSGVVFLYITFGNQAEAEKIGKMLVEARLAACVNIIPKIISIYRWRGEIENAQESVLIAKASKDNIESIIQKVKSEHSYELPCIVAFSVVKGYDEFINYIKTESKVS